MLHARGDTTVPAAQGDALWEALGRPERWVFPGDHAVVYWRLPSLADDLVRWVHTAARRCERDRGDDEAAGAEAARPDAQGFAAVAP